MEYTFDFNLEFNNDCDNPQIIVKDIFTSGTETIIDQTPIENVTINDDGLTIKYYESACSTNCNKVQATDENVVLNLLPSNLPEEYTLSNDDLYIPAIPGINKVGIQITYTEIVDDSDPQNPVTVEITKTVEKCIFISCDVMCCIMNKLIQDTSTEYLVNIYNSIFSAIECGNCCLACELYIFLKNKLNSQNCNSCK